MLKSPCFAKYHVGFFWCPYKLLILSESNLCHACMMHTHTYTHREHMGSKGGRFIPYTLSPERKRPYTVPDSFRAQRSPSQEKKTNLNGPSQKMRGHCRPHQILSIDHEKASHVVSPSLCNEHGTIYAISSDFSDRMTTQSIGLMVLLSEQF